MRPLAIPRTNISIGGSWLQGSGAITAGLPDDSLLVAGSVSSQNWGASTALRAGVVASLGSRLGFSGGGSSFTNNQVRLGDAEVVRVRNIASLGTPTAGSSYVWEGIRLKTFTFVDSTTREGTLRANAQGVAGGATLQAGGTIEGGRRRFYTVTGANLFVAFRVVQFSLDPAVSERTVVLPDSSRMRNAEFGAEYALEFVPDSTPDGCRGRLIISRFLGLASSGGPSEGVFPVWCTSSVESRTIPLPPGPNEAGFQMDRLILNSIRLRRDAAAPEDEAWVTGVVRLQRRILRISPMPEPVALGWTM